MILVDSKRTISWMSTTTGKKVETAILSNTGNLILQINETATAVWQSFDYPTDTWLPKMKLTFETIFRSWKSLINPATGRFSFKIDDYGALQLLWNEYVLYWKADLSIRPSTFVDTTQNRTYVSILTFFSNATSYYHTWMEKILLQKAPKSHK
ncbi:hypothetical protein O6H91_11G081100 [Diphasiastrum complanatum]|uniref:Uncharacterized protein n=1 Tax=Diphasiastrum complanatum TaxID=34168 RepID=A0ACC2CB24_DIPCM|nr:hypothetical protein O6H91_11G081100 [Diphasiastrum complanatum]